MRSQPYLGKWIGVLVLTSFAALASAQEHVKSVSAITEIFGDGQKVTALALEYDTAIVNSSLERSAFSVPSRTITEVYSNTSPGKFVPKVASGPGGGPSFGQAPKKGVDGKFVILELSAADSAAKTIQALGFGPSTKSKKAIVKVKVQQIGKISTADGKSYLAWAQGLDSDKVIDSVPGGFKQLVFKDPKRPGQELMYNLFLPADYSPSRSYPLVLFMADASATSDDPDMTLIQGLGAIVWASPAEQAKHECIVLAPQYSTRNGMDERPELTYDLVLAVLDAYSVDRNRVYTTGQSAGCITSIAIGIRHPELFAAYYLVAGQYDANQVAPLADKPIWITVAAGDMQALPGMNAITATLERHGAVVARGSVDARSNENEFAYHVADLEAQEGQVKFTMFQRGTVVAPGTDDNPATNHMGTWAIAYSIEGIRDWLFSQIRTQGLSAKDLSDLSLAQARGHDPFGAFSYALKAKAAGAGTMSLEMLADAYTSGTPGIPLDYALGVEYYQQAIQQGSARANTNLGILYQEGKGVAKDPAKALACFEKASALGDMKGPRYAGIIYLKGLGSTPVDLGKASSYFTLAAGRGDISANYYLGYLSENGLGLPRDYAKAAAYYQKAAPSDPNLHAEAMACTAMGRLYENGLGLAKDLAKAREWYTRGAALGDPDSKAALERLKGG